MVRSLWSVVGRSSSGGGSCASGILRWISTRQPVTRMFSTTSRSRRRRPSKSRSSSEAAIRSLKPASRRRRRFWVASSVLRLVSGLSFSRELVAPGGERAGASGELVEVEQTSLVGVEQPGALALVGVEGGVQAVELARRPARSRRRAFRRARRARRRSAAVGQATLGGPASRRSGRVRRRGCCALGSRPSC